MVNKDNDTFTVSTNTTQHPTSISQLTGVNKDIFKYVILYGSSKHVTKNSHLPTDQTIRLHSNGSVSFIYTTVSDGLLACTVLLARTVLLAFISVIYVYATTQFDIKIRFTQ